MKSTLTVRLPVALQRELKKTSREENVSISDMIRESLQSYLAVRKFKRMRKKTLPFAEAQGFLTDEDIFKEFS